MILKDTATLQQQEMLRTLEWKDRSNLGHGWCGWITITHAFCMDVLDCLSASFLLSKKNCFQSETSAILLLTANMSLSSINSNKTKVTFFSYPTPRKALSHQVPNLLLKLFTWSVMYPYSYFCHFTDKVTEAEGSKAALPRSHGKPL